jgi:hypothetical protein
MPKKTKPEQTYAGRIIAVDFDGTCVTHAYPEVGRDIGAAPVLRRLVEAGAFLILWTMRGGKHLRDAEQWFEDNGIELWAVNENPEQHRWTNSPKAYAHIYIDDAAFGSPLVQSTIPNERPYINWKAVEQCFFPPKARPSFPENKLVREGSIRDTKKLKGPGK